MVRLYYEMQGTGPDVVLLHGWGVSSQVWEPILPGLTSDYRVTCVDLPGHGRSPVLAGDDLGPWLEALIDVIPPGAVWMGWSLGGMLALAAADARPAAVRGVVIVASNLRFIAATDWPDAISPEVFQDVVDGVAVNPLKTLQRFVALQFLGVREGAEAARHLREQLPVGPSFNAGLMSGLDLLRTIDNRPKIREVSVPVKMVFGQKDKLVPLAVAEVIPVLNPAVGIATIAGAGHAPFLTHPEVFMDTVKPFIAEHAA